MHQRKQHTKLGQLPLRQGMGQEGEIPEAMGARKPGQKLGEVMLERKYLSEEQLAEALAIQLDLEFVRISGKADAASVKMMPGHIARRFMVFPVAVREAKEDYTSLRSSLRWQIP